MHQTNGPHRGCSGLGDALFDVLGTFGATGIKNTAGGRIHRLQLWMGFEEKAVRGQLKTHHLLELLSRSGRFDSHGQYQHVQHIVVQGSAGRVFNGHAQPSVGQFLHMTR